jgi:hypothetical protein
MRRYLIFAFLSLAGMAFGQVGTPLLGYLADGVHIRPVNGIPAAAAIQPALDLKQNFTRVVASPANDYALVTIARLGTVSIFTPAHGLTPLARAATAPDLVVTSPRGSAAVLWFSRTDSAEVVTGLPGAPVIRQITASFARTVPSSLAISDDGQWLAAAWSGGSQPGLYMWSQYGQVNQLPVLESVAAVAFFQGRGDLAVSIPHQVLTLRSADGFNVRSALYDSGDWQPDVAALAVSPDNTSVILADRTGWIVSIDAASGNAVKVDCGCRPEGLFGMGQSAFRLTGLDNGAIRLFDAVRSEVLFAPLALADGGTQ